jgi:hypothetical protein
MRSSRIKRANIPAQNTRLPLIGKVRIGERRTNSAGKEYPVSLDYFIATGAYAAKFNEVYPDKPTRIQIVFISDDDFQSCYEEWDGRDKEGRRAGYGDGETYWLWQYGKDEYKETTDRKLIADFTKQHGIKWKQVLTINFVIPAIKGVFGCWQLQTGGDKSSINAIRNTFDEIKEQAGTVVNIPFDLCVKKVTSNKPEAKSVYPVISLVPNISAENMEQLRAFFEAGLDVKRAGMLTEQKLEALGAHTTAVETTYEEVKADHAEPQAGVASIDEMDVAQRIKLCKTVDECNALFDNELFMEAPDSLLVTLLDDRIADLKAVENGKPS